MTFETYLKKFSTSLFQKLEKDENLSLQIHSEESDFIRFNHSKVRQNTQVAQHELTLIYIKDDRQYKVTFNLTLNESDDLSFAINKLKELRLQVPLTDINPKTIEISNKGQSSIYKKSVRPSTEQIIEIIHQQFQGTDMVGLWSSGPLRQASINSKGQFHYFENDSFFFDFSIYNGPRAAKGFYSDNQWNTEIFAQICQQTKNTLSLLNKPQMTVKPGSYRCYLAPMAVAELMSMFYWRSLSRSQFEQGFPALKKLYNKERFFNKKMTLIDNNQLGLDSHFNAFGELVPDQLTVVENGELKNFLTSTATAKEYGLTSNHAEPSEMLRSPEIRAGTLEEKDILSRLGTGLYLSNLHYINWSDTQTARITGMTRFACFWVENAEIVGPIQDMRFDESLYQIWGDQLEDLTKTQQTFTNTSTYLKRDKGGMKVPGMLLKGFNFTL